MKMTRLVLSLTALSLALHAQAPPATPAPRMLCMLFDLSTLDAAAQSRARDAAVKFVQQQATPSDRIAVMTYTSQLNVLQDFTESRDGILAALQTIMPSEAGNGAAAIPGAEFNIFMADRQLAAIQRAVELLAVFPEKKAMIYFSSGIPKPGVDNQAQLAATTNAAVRANVSIYPVDARGVVAVPR
jgi:VWFA-related protein